MTESASQHPASALAALRQVPLVCPLCKQPLAASEHAYLCLPCARTYPLHAGIPDFRVFADPYLSFAEDRERTEFVLEASKDLDFPGLLGAYWAISDVTPEELRGKFIRSAMLGEKKALRVLELLDSGNDSTANDRVLDIGCGTGGFLAMSMSRYQTVVGADIGMRWLHVSRRRFADKGLHVPALVCCCAEHLPFADGYFDQIVCSATLEFARDQDRVLSECARTTSCGGAAYFSTVNRFSLAQDPYVYLWGLGFMPRAWQARYVRYRKNASYENIHLLSLAELRRLFAAHFERVEIGLPDIDDDSLRQFPASKRFQVHLFRRLKMLPVVRQLLFGVSPQWDVKLSVPRKPRHLLQT